MYFGANSRCRIENCAKKAAVFLHPLYIIGLKIVLRNILWSNDFALYFEDYLMGECLT